MKPFKFDCSLEVKLNQLSMERYVLRPSQYAKMKEINKKLSAIQAAIANRNAAYSVHVGKRDIAIAEALQQLVYKPSRATAAKYKKLIAIEAVKKVNE